MNMIVSGEPVPSEKLAALPGQKLFDRIIDGDLLEGAVQFALEVADEVPARRSALRGDAFGLRDEFLGPVLTEVEEAGGRGLEDGLDGLGLAGAKEGDGGGVPTDRPGRGVDAPADVGQSVGEGGQPYFGSICCRAGSELWTCAAFGSFGASFRNVCSALIASGICPRLSDVMPSW